MNVDVIYIAGMGHSGTTLLNLILGAANNAFSAGEVKGLPSFMRKHTPQSILDAQGEKDHFRCDCGEELADCKFWSPIVKNFKPEDLIPHEPTLWNKLQALLHLYTGLPLKTKDYADNEVYIKILEQAKKIKGNNVKFIIDSSKDARRLLWLIAMPQITIHVLHIVRDGRGVVNSYKKEGYSSMRTFVDWIGINHILSKIGKKLVKKRYLQISYDKFAERPKKSLEKIQKEFGIQINLNNFVQDVNQESFHNFFGNPMRRSPLKGIRHDESWKKNLPHWKKRVLTVLCSIPNKLWVYD